MRTARSFLVLLVVYLAVCLSIGTVLFAVANRANFNSSGLYTRN